MSHNFQVLCINQNYSLTFFRLHNCFHGSLMEGGGTWRLTTDCRFWYSKAPYLFSQSACLVCVWPLVHICVYGEVNTLKSTENANFDSSVSNQLAFQINHTPGRNCWGGGLLTSPAPLRSEKIYCRLDPNHFCFSCCL